MKQVKWVWVGVTELKKFIADNPEARMMSWPHTSKCQIRFGFYVYESEPCS